MVSVRANKMPLRPGLRQSAHTTPGAVQVFLGGVRGGVGRGVPQPWLQIPSPPLTSKLPNLSVPQFLHSKKQEGRARPLGIRGGRNGKAWRLAGGGGPAL